MISNNCKISNSNFFKYSDNYVNVYENIVGKYLTVYAAFFFIVSVKL